MNIYLLNIIAKWKKFLNKIKNETKRYLHIIPKNRIFINKKEFYTNIP